MNDLPEFILVAVSSAELACACNRQKEYTVTEYSTAKHEPFVRYITEVVKVEVDTKFRTKPGREHTFTLGASLGGLFAFILSLSRSDVFSGCVCLSPAFWFVDRSNMSIYSMIPTRGDHDVPCQIYVDSGDGEGDNKEVVRYMSEVLKERGWKDGQDFKYQLEHCSHREPYGVTHSERVWRERVITGLKYILRLL